MKYIKIIDPGTTVKVGPQEFKGGHTYEVTESTAKMLIAEGWAIEVEKPESETAP